MSDPSTIGFSKEYATMTATTTTRKNGQTKAVRELKGLRSDARKAAGLSRCCHRCCHR